MDNLKDRAEFLQKKNDDLVRELKKKNQRLEELEITIKVLRRLNGEDK